MQNLVISINAEIYYEVETLKYKNIILNDKLIIWLRINLKKIIFETFFLVL